MIAIISDVHGNLPALKAVLEKIDALGCETVISLGDVVGYYAQPGECIDLLRDRGIVNILGNHDHYIVSGEGCPRSKLVSDITEYQRGIISPQQVAWLAQSHSYIIDGSTYFIHGGWQDPVDQYLYTIAQTDIPAEAETFFAGHTHVQVLLDVKGRTFCNPGAVGQPRDGDPRAAFATFEDGRIELRRVGYDIDETAFHMKEAGFPAKCYENLYLGAQIGGRIDKITLAV